MSACRRTICFATLIVATSFCTASAQTAAAPTPGKTPIHRTAEASRPSAAAGTGTSGGTTLVFLGLLLAGAIVVRRMVQQRQHQPRGRSAANAVTLLGRQQIDNELTVRLLQIGPRVLVVGSSPQGLTTLSEITDPDEIAALCESSPSPARSTDRTPMFDGQPMNDGSRDSTDRTGRQPVGRSTSSPPTIPITGV